MEPTSSTPLGPKNNYLIPASIIIAGALIAGALFAAQLINGNRGNTNTQVKRPDNPHLEVNLNPVTDNDHIRGRADAPIKLVEFSDTDCPYCQLFHPTVKNLVDTYPEKVAWVYRHFNTGIPSHPHTKIEAEATECVAKLGTNDKFWQFLDLLYVKKDFNVSPAKLIDPATLPTLAASIGINKAQFSDCLNKGTYSAEVVQDTTDAQDSGGNGTPFSIVITKNAVSKELEKLINETNAQYIKQFPTAPDIAFVSKDKKMIVLSGAMPQELMAQIFSLLVKTN